MLLSEQDMFSDAQTIGTDIGNTNSEDILDWAAHGDDVGRFLSLFIMLTNTAASNGASTLTITWQTSANGTDYSTIATYGPFALADLASGKYLVNGEPLPKGILKYNKLVYAGGGANFTTAPIVTAGIVRNDVPIER